LAGFDSPMTGVREPPVLIVGGGPVGFAASDLLAYHDVPSLIAQEHGPPVDAGPLHGGGGDPAHRPVALAVGAGFLTSSDQARPCREGSTRSEREDADRGYGCRAGGVAPR
jgi:hypothetical protein